jgi:pyrroloquinoline quinone biosynthesis protein A
MRRRSSSSDTREEITMTWETPQACDLRFGFEITMYIAAR